jgi:OmpA-OmpF porin, OOP family
MNVLRRVAIGLCAAFCITVVSSHGAYAAGYVGAGFGQSSVDITCDLDITCESDEKDNAFKVFGGLQVNPNFALEVAYLDLGEAKISGTDTVFGTFEQTIAVTGFNVAAVLSAPVGERFKILGKAGIFLWDMDLNLASSLVSGSLSESGNSFMFGLGGAMELDRVGVRLEWERFVDVGEEDVTGQSDVDVVSASIYIRF